jgi:RNA polymerase sigma-70 factor (ECF subfamily)
VLALDDPSAGAARIVIMVGDLRSLADEELIHLARHASAEAFAVLYERHAGSAYALAYRMTGTRGSAEDVTQEAFLSVWRSGGRYDPRRGSVRTWILGIVHNRAIDALRRGRVRDFPRATDEGAAERVPSEQRTEVAAVRREEANTVRRALADLPADQLQALELAYFGGFTHTEIAEMLDAPLGTIKGRIRLGLRKLRENLGEAVVTP